MIILHFNNRNFQLHQLYVYGLLILFNASINPPSQIFNSNDAGEFHTISPGSVTPPSEFLHFFTIER